MSRPIHSIGSGFVDMPGRYAITLFFKGCNLRCPFCHNLEVVNSDGYISLDDAHEFVKRIGDTFLGGMGVVMSGGEPTGDMNELSMAVERFKDYPLGIHTNGIRVPKFENPFESVVLSLKSPHIIGMERWEYLAKIVEAATYYSSARYKELRYVINTVTSDDLAEIAEAIGDEWKFAGVDDSTWR